MAGGRGKRFWPKSRITRPKQILKIVDQKKSMIQITLDRIKTLIPKENVQIVTNTQQVDLIRQQLPKLNDENFVIEPTMRNTAPCIGLSAILLNKRDPESVMLVLPADHIIKDKEEFLDTVKASYKVAKDRNVLITFGIRPTFASTGYGYIQIVRGSRFKVRSKDIYAVKRFTEKPDKSKARRFVGSGNYFWNSGMFVWKTSTILSAFKLFMPDLYYSLLKIKEKIDSRNFRKRLKQIYGGLEDKSIDYGVMEPATSSKLGSGSPEVVSINSDFGWNDVGSWRSLENILPKDEGDNVRVGKNIELGVKDSIIVSDEKHLVSVVDVEDIIIVHTDDATLVCHKDSAQKVKKLLKYIEKEDLKEYL